METFFNKNKHDKKKSLYTFEWFPHGWMVLKCSRTFKIRCTQGGSSNLFKTCLSIDDWTFINFEAQNKPQLMMIMLLHAVCVQASTYIYMHRYVYTCVAPHVSLEGVNYPSATRSHRANLCVKISMKILTVKRFFCETAFVHTDNDFPASLCHFFFLLLLLKNNKRHQWQCGSVCLQWK